MQLYPAIAALPPALRDPVLEREAQHLKVSAGSPLFTEGSPCQGFPLVLDFVRAVAPQAVVDAIASLSFLTHFAAITKGVIDLRDVLFFLLTIGFWLYASAIVIDLKKAD